MLGLNDSGFVLRLGPDAGIEAIAGHGSGAGLSEWVGRPFPTLLDPSALGRALDFFTRVRAEGAQYRWDLPLAGSRRILMFAGATAGPAVLVAAAASVTALDLRLAGLSFQLDPHAQARMVELAAQAARAEAGDHAILTDFASLTNELAAIQRELARKNLMLSEAVARKNLMLGMAAHDLRNPLSVVANCAEHLQDSAAGRLAPSERLFLDYIRNASLLMQEIIDGCLALSRAETGTLVLKTEACDVAALVAEACAINATLAERRGVAVEADPAAPLPPLLLDRAKIMQVLNNLIGNAVKFAPTGTAVTVTLAQLGNRFEVAVADRGPGVADSRRDTLFVPFSHASEPGPDGAPSNGLGLAISKTIVAGHGGTITYAPRPGGGAVFSFTLPCRWAG